MCWSFREPLGWASAATDVDVLIAHCPETLAEALAETLAETVAETLAETLAENLTGTLAGILAVLMHMKCNGHHELGQTCEQG